MSSLPPMPMHFTRTRTEAVFVLEDAQGPHTVRLSIGEPVQDLAVVGGWDWRCPVRLMLGAHSEVYNACGIDAQQALAQAQALAGQQLQALVDRPARLFLPSGQAVDTAQSGWAERLLPPL